MAAEEEVVILARLAGTTQFIRNAGLVTGSMEEMQVAADGFVASEDRIVRHSYLMNQALFTVRRLLYGVSLAALAVGVGAIKLGFNFNSAMQQARVALYPVRKDLGGVQKELTYLFNFTKYTPFQFKDVTIAFRQMYLGMHPLGISANEVNQTLVALADNLAATGKTSPGALNRVSIALQHMAYQGHLTGYSVNQLARDGIQIFAALHKELGLTGDQIHRIGTLGIPTQTVLQAIIKYTESTPGLMNAAHNQATKSLHGLFTTFKDNISQLMGNMETNVFNRFQSRLVRFNAFFDSISNKLQHKASFASIIGAGFGGGAEFIWKQFAADLDLVWKIFTKLISAVVQSKSTWGALMGVLILLHGILVPINYLLGHFGWLIRNIIIPAMILNVAVTKTLIFWETIQKFLLKSTTTEWKSLTLTMYAARVAMTLYYFTLGRIIVLTQEWVGIRSALNVLLTGTALGTEYRALSSLELMALRLRSALVRLFAPLAAVVAESWAFTASLLANPITWIILAVVALTGGLVYLYFRWKAFHDIVNQTVGFLWRHPLLAAITPVIGPLIAMARLTYEIYKHLRDIYNLARHPIRSLGSGNFWSSAAHFGLNVLQRGLGMPRMASGGFVTRSGQAVVGEQGPEILSLPAGAAVQPLQWSMMNKGPDGATGPPRQLVVQFVVGQRVLESAIVDIMGGRLAQA